jgi:hypothetical protein
MLDFASPSASLRRELDTVAEGLVENFRDLVSELAQVHGESILWLTAYPASGHSYGSRLFERCLIIRFLIREINKPNFSSVTKITVSDFELAAFLRKLLVKLKVEVPVEFESEGKVKSRIGRLIAPHLEFVKSLLILSVRFFKKRSGSRLKFLNKKVRIADTFILKDGCKGGFNSEGKFIDRYFCGLKENLPIELVKDFYWWPTLLSARELGKNLSIARSSAEQFLIPDDWLRVGDFLAICLGPICLRKARVPDIFFDGVNIRALVRSEVNATYGNWSSMLGHLYYRSIRRMAKWGLKIECWLSWFENQPIDRGVIKGLREFFPTAKIIGYQGFAVCPVFNHYLVPTETESQLGLAPDELVFPSKYLIARVFSPAKSIKLRSGPAFRFRNFVGKRSIFSYRCPVILVALPISEFESKKLLEFTLKAIQAIRDLSFCLRVKPHPTQAISWVKSIVASFHDMENILIEERPFHLVLEETSILVGLSSSTSVEAFVAGKFVAICSVSSVLTQNPTRGLEGTKERVKVCFSPTELNDVLSQWLLVSNNGEDLVGGVDMFFEPITRQGCRSLVGCGDDPF